MPLSIRPLSPPDFALIENLARRIWPVAYGAILTPIELENLLSNIYSGQNLAKEVYEGHRFWGAFDGETALGFASGYHKENTIWLKKLYVLPEAQGKGAGRALLETVIAAFAPAEDARLYVNADNRAAQDFYRRLGFANSGAVPVRMGDFDFTDFVFVKPL